MPADVSMIRYVGCRNSFIIDSVVERQRVTNYVMYLIGGDCYDNIQNLHFTLFG